MKHGNGILKFINGDVYEGEFIEGEMQGRGIYKWSNRYIYEGKFY